MFKFVNLTERVTLRFNIDFFNMFNHPNDPTSISSNGVPLHPQFGQLR